MAAYLDSEAQVLHQVQDEGVVLLVFRSRGGRQRQRRPQQELPQLRELLFLLLLLLLLLPLAIIVISHTPREITRGVAMFWFAAWRLPCWRVQGCWRQHYTNLEHRQLYCHPRYSPFDHLVCSPPW